MFIGINSSPSTEEALHNLSVKADQSGIVRFGAAELDLRERPMAFALFDVFFRRGNSPIYVDDLTDLVYGSNFDRSERMNRSMRHNTIKLVSRCRRMAEKRFGSTAHGLKIKWLPFDHKRDAYQIYEASLMPTLSAGRRE